MPKSSNQNTTFRYSALIGHFESMRAQLSLNIYDSMKFEFVQIQIVILYHKPALYFANGF